MCRERADEAPRCQSRGLIHQGGQISTGPHSKLRHKEYRKVKPHLERQVLEHQVLRDSRRARGRWRTWAQLLLVWLQLPVSARQWRSERKVVTQPLGHLHATRVGEASHPGPFAAGRSSEADAGHVLPDMLAISLRSGQPDMLATGSHLGLPDMLATDAVAVDGSAVAGAVGAQCGSAGPEEQAFRGFVTANTTGARNLKEFLKCTRADVVCAQELRVAGDKARSLVNWAHWNGWKAIVNDGMVSEETGRLSAGVGIFARSHLGLGHPQGGPARTTDGRAVAAVVEIPGLPQMLVVAAYFRVGEKVSVGNLELMKEVGQWCAVRKMPFLIGVRV